VTNVVLLPRAAHKPEGDAVSCDVAREAASDILARLHELGLDEDGSITIQSIEAAPSRGARDAERAAPGSPDDGVVWDVVEQRAVESARGSWSFYVFLTLATTIASVAVVLDSPILIVGAMVVGPEFGPVAGIATGIALRRWSLSTGALRLLAISFPAAILVTTLLALLARAAGWIQSSAITGARPLTGFIYAPDRWSLVVALLAGAAGVLSLTAGKTNALVGVFISVTTVPAAGNLALALALWVPHEIRGSALQLVVNLLGMTLAGLLVLLVQRRVWPVRVGHRATL
jgi:uncharacterized hydrophobic protein (TIGR00271 family)